MHIELFFTPVQPVMKTDPVSITIAFLIFMNALAGWQFYTLAHGQFSGPAKVNFSEPVQR